MLKHPHRDHAIEPPLGIQLIHVGSDHFQIRETATRRLGINKPFLRSGIGNSQKPQRACSPSFLEMNPEPRTPCPTTAGAQRAFIAPQNGFGLSQNSAFPNGARWPASDIEAYASPSPSRL